MIHSKKNIEVGGGGKGVEVKIRSKIKFYLQNVIVKVIFIIICQAQFQIKLGYESGIDFNDKILPLVTSFNPPG